MKKQNYIIHNDYEEFYDIVVWIKIEENESFLNKIDSERGENDVDTIGEDFDTYNESTRSGLGDNKGDNVNVEGQQSWSEYIAGILKKLESKRTRSGYNSNESYRYSIRELDNSSFSSAKKDCKVSH